MAGDEERGTGRGVIRSVMELSPEIGEREMCGERRWPPVMYLIFFVNC